MIKFAEDNVLYSRRQAASFVNRKPSTLRQWAWLNKTELPFTKQNGKSEYLGSDINAYLFGILTKKTK